MSVSYSSEANIRRYVQFHLIERGDVVAHIYEKPFTSMEDLYNILLRFYKGDYKYLFPDFDLSIISDVTVDGIVMRVDASQFSVRLTADDHYSYTRVTMVNGI